MAKNDKKNDNDKIKDRAKKWGKYSGIAGTALSGFICLFATAAAAPVVVGATVATGAICGITGAGIGGYTEYSAQEAEKLRERLKDLNTELNG